MHFRFSILYLLSLFLQFFLQPCLQAEETYPLGIIIRPDFFSSVSKAISLPKDSFPINECQDNVSLQGSLRFQLENPDWPASNQGSALMLSMDILNFVFEGGLSFGCDSREKPEYLGSATLEKLKIPIGFYPELLLSENREKISENEYTGLIRVDPYGLSQNSFNPVLKLIEAQTGKEPQRLSQILHSRAVLDLLWKQIKVYAERKLSQLIGNRLRGLVYQDSIADLLGTDSPFSKRGPILKRGGLQIDMDGPPLTRRASLFGFTPYKNQSVFIGNRSLEIYVGGQFFSEDILKSTRIFGSLFPQIDDSQLLSRLKERLEDSHSWPSAEFKRPQLPFAKSDISLIIPTALVNEALRSIYREGLLRFKTTINLGQQTQGIINPEAPEVSTIIGIRPQTAPSLNFLANRPTLQISNYEVQVSTAMEDRLIPSANILTNGSLEAALRMSPETGTINLVLDTSTFQLKLEDLSNRLSPEQLSLFEKLALGLWKDFLSRYHDLILFPSIIDLKNAGLDNANMQVVDVNVSQSTILLHINMLWKGPGK